MHGSLPSLAMNLTVGVVQGLLAAFFAVGGVVKMARSPKRLHDQGLTWVEDFPPGGVKVIGALELAAAIGLVVPRLTGIAPVLVPLAAAGLGLLMIGAAVVHLRRHEAPFIVVNALVIAAAGLVAWARFGPYAL